VFFLLKCFACIALVLFALGWRGVDAPSNVADPRVRVVSTRSSQRPELEARARDMAQTAADALAAAARDKCLAAPRDCAALLQHYQGGERRR
jgi:hypothetical protein